MSFQDVFDATKASIQDSLDDIASNKTSSKAKLQALKNLERNLALACCGTEAALDAKDSFLTLQYTFECNIPSRLLSCIATSTIRLEALITRGSVDGDRTTEAEDITTQLLLILTIIQGVVLTHEPSKAYLGRKVNLETLLDLLLVSRHLSSPSTSSQDPRSQQPENLTSVVIDTLLCILVDSSASLRAFEQANGVQVVVKILKRAGTPREVRMRCLEFLYFYLLDETPNTIHAQETSIPASTTPARKTPPPTPAKPSVPATPAPMKTKPFLNATPLRPSGRYPSSSLGVSGKDGLASSTSSRSTSGGSVTSFNSSTSNLTTSTAMSSPSTSPQKPSSIVPPPASQYRFPLTSKSPIKQRLHTPQHANPRSPPTSPPASIANSSSSSSSSSSSRFPQLRSMMMLRKEVDYTPQSPIKRSHSNGQQQPIVPATPSQHSSALGHHNHHPPRRPGHAKTQSLVTGLPSQTTARMYSIASRADTDDGHRESGSSVGGMRAKDENWKTTEEKKELLGTMLGNVDALVEGVRKAGIWGLS